MKVDKTTYDNSLAADDSAIGISVGIKRGAETLEEYFIVGTVSEEFGRVAGTMLSALTALKKADGTQAIDVDELNAITKIWRGLIHG